MSSTLEHQKIESLLSKRSALAIMEKIYLARAMDEKMELLVRQNKGTSFFLSTAGHELIGVCMALALEAKKDWGFPYYRDRSFALGLGIDPKDILAAFLARESEHHSKGRMMLDHFSDPNFRLACQSSCVGSQFLQAVGMAKAISRKNGEEIVYVSGGDGSTSQGDFHEALNFSCIHKLPIVFVIQDNGWAISVPLEEQTAGGNIAPLTRGYQGLSVFEVNGSDIEEVYKATKEAAAAAREKGPAVIIAHVPRLKAHTSSDDHNKYKTKEHFEDDLLKDPIYTTEQFLLRKGWISKASLEEMRQKIEKEVEAYSIEAEKVPFPSEETADHFVFKESVVEEQALDPISDQPIVMMDALNHALIEEMEKDEGVIVFGQDVAHGKGGVFGITRTLTNRFGKERCFNTPLAESTIVGMAIGMSQDGYHKPVAEIQFVDYCWTGMNQIANELASIHYRSAGDFHCPVVLRMPYGGYIQGGPYHSQSIEAIFAHVPGLKVVIPSNASDAKRLLKTAIRDPNPVIFLEHKALYRQHKFSARLEPAAEDLLPFGKANIVKKGNDLTLVAWGMSVVMASEVCDTLEKEGVSVELIDLRTLVPFDEESIMASVKKTGKLLIAHEAPQVCGFGAEIAAIISQKAFAYLDAPIMRLTGKNCPIPFAKNLENIVLPQKKDFEKAILELAHF